MVIPRSERLVEFAWVAIGQLFSFVGGVAAVKILTMYLAPSGYGMFFMGLTLASIMVLLTYGPMSQVVSRFFQNAIDSGTGEVVFAWVKSRFGLAVAATSASSLVVAAWFGSRGNHEWVYLLVIAVVLGAALGLSTNVAVALNATRKRKWFAVQQGCEAVLKPLIAVLAMTFLFQNWMSALIGFCLGIVVTLLLLSTALPSGAMRRFIKVSKHVKGERPVQLWIDMNRYSAPFVLFGIVALIGLHGDKLILQQQLGSAAVGIYAAMYQIANAPVALVLAVLNQFTLPFLFVDRKSADSANAQRSTSARQYRTLLVLSVAVLGVTCLVLYQFGEWILALLTTKEFTVHHQSLWLLGAGLACFHLAQQLHIAGFIANKPSIYVLPKFLHSAAFLAGAVMIGLDRGVPGICIAYLVASALYLVSVVVANARLTGISGTPRRSSE